MLLQAAESCWEVDAPVHLMLVGCLGSRVLAASMGKAGEMSRGLAEAAIVPAQALARCFVAVVAVFFTADVLLLLHVGVGAPSVHVAVSVPGSVSDLLLHLLTHMRGPYCACACAWDCGSGSRSSAAGKDGST